MSEPSHHGAALALSNASTTATLAAMRSDELAIDRLFAEHRCTHAYLDVGTNIGVQLRKLFEPSKYPKSLVLKPVSYTHLTLPTILLV